MIRRLSIYFKTMFPLQIHVPFAIVMYFSLFFLIQAIRGFGELYLSGTAIAGCSTLLGVMLLMRILDEFKDVEIDQKLFPGRPLLTGVVKYRDIYILGILVFMAISICNLLLGGRIFFFYIIMMIYIWLTFKWFFSAKAIKNSLILALITHQPVSLFVNVYIVSTALAGNTPDGDYFQLSLAILAFTFPVFAWETSRKIRAEGRETEYVTYSKLFGSRKASLLPLSSLLLFLLVLYILGFDLSFDPSFFLIMICIGIVVIIGYVRFILVPVEKRLILKPLSEMAVFLSLLIVLIYLITNI